jgi:hypothetical protein
MTNTDVIITPTPDKGKISRLIRWIFFGLIVFILCVSQIRRTNENGDIRDFSLVDDLSKLVQLHVVDLEHKFGSEPEVTTFHRLVVP